MQWLGLVWRTLTPTRRPCLPATRTLSSVRLGAGQPAGDAAACQWPAGRGWQGQYPLGVPAERPAATDTPAADSFLSKSKGESEPYRQAKAQTAAQPAPAPGPGPVTMPSACVPAAAAFQLQLSKLTPYIPCQPGDGMYGVHGMNNENVEANDVLRKTSSQKSAALHDSDPPEHTPL